MTSNPDLKNTPLFDVHCLINGTRRRHSYNGILLGTYTGPPTHRCKSNDLVWLWMRAKFLTTRSTVRPRFQLSFFVNGNLPTPSHSCTLMLPVLPAVIFIARQHTDARLCTMEGWKANRKPHPSFQMVPVYTWLGVLRSFVLFSDLDVWSFDFLKLLLRHLSVFKNNFRQIWAMYDFPKTASPVIRFTPYF